MDLPIFVTIEISFSFDGEWPRCRIGPGNCDYPGGRKKDKNVAMKCALFTSGIGICCGHEIDMSEKKNISGGARRLFDSEQVILSTNFYRNFFDRAIVVRIQLFLQLLSVQFLSK